MADENLTRVVTVAAKHFDVPPDGLDASSGPEQIQGWDSLAHVAFVSAIEAEFGVSFEIDEIMEMENLGAVAQMLGRKLSGRAATVTTEADAVSANVQQRATDRGRFTLRRNDYDSDAFARECWELTLDGFEQPPDPQQLDDFLRAAVADAVTCRLEQPSVELLASLRAAGLFHVDAQLHYTIQLPAEAPPGRTAGSFSVARDDQRGAIADIADRSLRSGASARRFFEMPGVTEVQVGQRYRAWAGQLARDNPATAFLWQVDDEPVGFYLAAASKDAGVADLLLAGVDPTMSAIVGPALFRGAARALYDLGYRLGRSTTSASNLEVLNLASYVGGLKVLRSVELYLADARLPPSPR